MPRRARRDADGRVRAQKIVVRDDLSQVHRMVAPPCTAPTSRVEVLKVRRDPAQHPSLNVERLSVDLRVQFRDPRALWLLRESVHAAGRKVPATD
jgi:hypothetical protein